MQLAEEPDGVRALQGMKTGRSGFERFLDFFPRPCPLQL